MQQVQYCPDTKDKEISAPPSQNFSFPTKNRRQHVRLFIVRVTLCSFVWKSHHQRTFFFTADRFPSIIRRSPVVRSIQMMISPIEDAIETIKEKNQELREVIHGVKIQHRWSNDLTTSLQSKIPDLRFISLDALEGVTSTFTARFYREEFLSNENNAHLVRKFQRALQLQCDVLAEGLQLHKMHVPANLLGLQHKLEGEEHRLV